MTAPRAKPRPSDVPAADPALARDALARVMSSDAFRGAPQLASFLAYIVDLTLEGRSGEIKGYTIATQALGRDADFDPQTDPIVRVEAMRLRRALEAYYAEAGAADPLRITIPRGTYIPAFEPVAAAVPDRPEPPTAPAPAPPAPEPVRKPRSSALPTSRLPWRLAAALGVAAFAVTGLAVLPPQPRPALDMPDFQPRISVVLAGPETDGAALRDAVVDRLAAFDEVSVDAAAAPERSYRLTLRVERTGAQVQARLAHGGRVVWSRALPLADDLAPRIAGLVGGPQGIVLADLRSRAGEGACLAAAVAEAASPSPRRAGVRACLEHASRRGRGAGLAEAYLARFALDEASAAPEAIDRAWSLARRALALRPDGARAHQALMDVLFERGDIEEALAAGRRAVAANPEDPDVRAGLALRLVQAGRFEEGAREAGEALARSPAPPAWHALAPTLAALAQGDGLAAAAAAARLDPAGLPLGRLLRAAAAGSAGREEDARREVAALLDARPDLRRAWPRAVRALARHPDAAARIEALLAPLMPTEAADAARG